MNIAVLNRVKCAELNDFIFFVNGVIKKYAVFKISTIYFYYY